MHWLGNFAMSCRDMPGSMQNRLIRKFEEEAMNDIAGLPRKTESPDTAVKSAAAFDFDAWARLARENPEEFERQRTQALQALLTDEDRDDPRIRGLLWRIDIERNRAASPLESLGWMMQEMKRTMSRLHEESDMLVNQIAERGK